MKLKKINLIKTCALFLLYPTVLLAFDWPVSPKEAIVEMFHIHYFLPIALLAVLSIRLSRSFLTNPHIIISKTKKVFLYSIQIIISLGLLFMSIKFIKVLILATNTGYWIMLLIIPFTNFYTVCCAIILISSLIISIRSYTLFFKVIKLNKSSAHTQ